MALVEVTDKKYGMYPALRSNLDSIIYNLKRDWDFIIVITGSGNTRVGKSLLAQQVAYYFAYNLGTKFDLENVVWDSEELIEKALEMPKNSVIIYDEAREGLESKKAIEKESRGLFDFFSQNGALNQIIILVMPDFFEMSKGIAVNRSIFLLNTYYTNELRQTNIKGRSVEVQRFRRGYFEFYNKKNKRKLYIKGKRNFFSYEGGLFNWRGKFPNYWVLPLEGYNQSKLEYIKRQSEREMRGNFETRFYILINELMQKYETVKALHAYFKNIGICVDYSLVGRWTRRARELNNTSSPPEENVTEAQKQLL